MQCVESHEDLWDACLDELSQSFSKRDLDIWLRPLVVSLEDGPSPTVSLVLRLPSPFHRRLVRERFDSAIRRVLNNLVPGPVHLSYEAEDPVVEDEGSCGPEGKKSTCEDNCGTFRSLRTVPSADILHAAGLNARYTLEGFVEGPSNRLARSAAEAIVSSPGGTAFNPLFLYSTVGLGKTHLANAIGCSALRQHQNLAVVYVTSEQFITEFVHSIRSRSVAQFARYYRSIDLLIVDDIQFLSGKEKTLEEFGNVFNELHVRGKQIILCADRPPTEIEDIDDRLLSRFRWGLSTDMQPPSLKTRVAILQQKAHEWCFDLPAEVAVRIGELVTWNVRSLEGALNQLRHASTVYELPLSVELVDRLLGESTVMGRVAASDIVTTVARKYGVPTELVYGRSRKRGPVFARQLAMFLCRDLTSKTFSEIGRLFDGRDHSTVIHACETIKSLRDTDEKVAATLASLVNQLR